MGSLLQIILSRDLDGIRGTHIAGTAPIRQELINAALNEEISEQRGAVQQFDLRILDNNRLQVGVRAALGPFSKWFRPEVIVAPQALGSRAPLLLLTITSHYGVMVRLIELLAKGRLPPGVVVRNQQLSIDFGILPQTAAYRQFFEHLKQLVITTRLGVLSVDFELKID